MMENVNVKRNDSFWSWLRHEKFSVSLALMIFIVPYLYQWIYNSIEITDVSGEATNRIAPELVYDISHVAFILVSLILLVRSAFLVDVNQDDNKGRLFTYVKEVFDENSKIAENGQDGLFKIVSFTVRQFYYSWIVVWCIWLLMYFNNLIYYLYSDKNFLGCGTPEMFRFKCFFENFLNLTNSFVLLFIYFIITVSSVSVSTIQRDRGQLHMGVIVLVFLGMIYFSIDVMSVFLDDPEKYNMIQFYLKLFVGIAATVSLMGVLGRLNSSFLNIPQSLIIALYVYASLQMLYPFVYVNPYNGVLLEVCSIVWIENVYASLQVLYPVIDVNPDNRVPQEAYNVEGIKNVLYMLAFGGKVCMFFVLRWIIQKRRFMFFVIHKAHSMIESEDMVKKFNRFMSE